MLTTDARPDAGADSPELIALYRAMEPAHLKPLWTVMHALLTHEPRSPAVAHKWDFAQVRAWLMRAGELISAERAERRVLVLENPALPGQSATTHSLYAGLQMILPGEIAPCHRHVQSALRFILEGEGGYTTVDGEKAVMRPGDLILTPSLQWHDHGNPSDAPMIWLDGLDIPTVRLFDAGFADDWPEKVHPTTAPAGDTLARYGGNMRPLRGSEADRRPATQPLFHYPAARWRPALAEMAGTAPIDPHLGHALEFINPATGGSVVPTMSAHVRFLPAGFETRARRATDGTIFVVADGEGQAEIGGETIALGLNDVVVVPAWTPHQLVATRDLTLFGFSDRATQEKLGFYREDEQ